MAQCNVGVKGRDDTGVLECFACLRESDLTQFEKGRRFVHHSARSARVVEQLTLALEVQARQLQLCLRLAYGELVGDGIKCGHHRANGHALAFAHAQRCEGPRDLEGKIDGLHGFHAPDEAVAHL